MSTDGNLPDLKFPQTGGQGNSIHLSANTLKQHGRNGESSTRLNLLLTVPCLKCNHALSTALRVIQVSDITEMYWTELHSPITGILFYYFFFFLGISLQMHVNYFQFATQILYWAAYEAREPFQDFKHHPGCRRRYIQALPLNCE